MSKFINIFLNRNHIKIKILKKLLPVNLFPMILKEWREMSAFNKDDDFVFNGVKPKSPICAEAILDNFRKALKRAGINDNNERKIVVHSSRHANNTFLLNKLPEKIVKNMVGHKSEKMTEVYNHPDWNEVLKGLQPYKELINNVWG